MTLTHRPFRRFFNKDRDYLKRDGRYARSVSAGNAHVFQPGDEVYVTCGPFTGTRKIMATGSSEAGHSYAGYDWYAIQHRGHRVFVMQNICVHPSYDPAVLHRLAGEDSFNEVERSYLETAREFSTEFSTEFHGGFKRESEQERLSRNPRPYGYSEQSMPRRADGGSQKMGDIAKQCFPPAEEAA